MKRPIANGYKTAGGYPNEKRARLRLAGVLPEKSVDMTGIAAT
jgi:hypothetical protein